MMLESIPENMPGVKPEDMPKGMPKGMLWLSAFLFEQFLDGADTAAAAL